MLWLPVSTCVYAFVLWEEKNNGNILTTAHQNSRVIMAAYQCVL
jgi:hypothetical protein